MEENLFQSNMEACIDSFIESDWKGPITKASVDSYKPCMSNTGEDLFPISDEIKLDSILC